MTQGPNLNRPLAAIMSNPDRFIDQDKPHVMYEKAGLNASGIVASVFAALGRDLTSESARA